jgi:hypothetical protein
MVELKDIVADAANLLVQGHGFTRTGRRFVREDDLIRSVSFMPDGLGRFEIVFSMGISGISVAIPKNEKWVVSCLAGQFRPKEVPARAWLTLTKGAYDEEVKKHARRVCECVVDEFLLKYRTVDEFYLWVRANALELFHDPRADNEYRRLKLQPFNVVGPLELAAVYAAYLGRTDDSIVLQNATIEFASAHDIDYAIPRVIANIADASRHEEGLSRRRHSGSRQRSDSRLCGSREAGSRAACRQRRRCRIRRAEILGTKRCCSLRSSGLVWGGKSRCRVGTGAACCGVVTLFYVVQHGEKESRPGDPGLTDLGCRQASGTASRLHQVGVSAVFSSPMRRARETAGFIASAIGVPVREDSRLRERMNGDGAQTFEEFLADWAASVRDRSFVPRTGDSSWQAGERFLAFLREVAGNPGPIVVLHPWRCNRGPAADSGWRSGPAAAVAC